MQKSFWWLQPMRTYLLSPEPSSTLPSGKSSLHIMDPIHQQLSILALIQSMAPWIFPQNLVLVKFYTQSTFLLTSKNTTTTVPTTSQHCPWAFWVCVQTQPSMTWHAKTLERHCWQGTNPVRSNNVMWLQSTTSIHLLCHHLNLTPIHCQVYMLLASWYPALPHWFTNHPSLGMD